MEKHIVVTIGREYGSGGHEIGLKLAEKLGLKFYDKEILAVAAKESGLCEEIFEMHDEQPTKSFLHSLVMDTYAMGYGSSSFVDMPMNHKVFLAQFEAIKKLADSESCVIVGRCADYALENHPALTSVFIHSDLDKRIKRISERNHLSEAKAKEDVSKTDKRRLNYYNYYSSKRWGEAKGYDLSLNSGKLGIDNTVDIIIDFINKRID